jgi:hypothetical protein
LFVGWEIPSDVEGSALDGVEELQHAKDQNADAKEQERYQQ